MTHDLQQPLHLSVQHELLLALLGHTGDLFLDMSETGRAHEGNLKDPKGPGLKVVPGADWLDPCHRSTLPHLGFASALKHKGSFQTAYDERCFALHVKMSLHGAVCPHT